MMRDTAQKLCVELESSGVHALQLPCAVDELKEDWRVFFRRSLAVAYTLLELVACMDPLLLNKLQETHYCAVVRVEAHHCECAHLACSVPAVAAVAKDCRCAAVHRGRTTERGGENATDMQEPFGVFH
jgi:hypothetical protein